MGAGQPGGGSPAPCRARGRGCGGGRCPGPARCHEAAQRSTAQHSAAQRGRGRTRLPRGHKSGAARSRPHSPEQAPLPQVRARPRGSAPGPRSPPPLRGAAPLSAPRPARALLPVPAANLLLRFLLPAPCFASNLLPRMLRMARAAPRGRGLAAPALRQVAASCVSTCRSGDGRAILLQFFQYIFVGGLEMLGAAGQGCVQREDRLHASFLGMCTAGVLQDTVLGSPEPSKNQNCRGGSRAGSSSPARLGRGSLPAWRLLNVAQVAGGERGSTPWL